MAKTNVKAVVTARTHEGAPADPRQPAELELERTVASCLLFEDAFYEGGESIAKRIESLVSRASPERVALLADRARNVWHIRHASLFLARQLAKRYQGRLVSDTIFNVIQRADELAEFLAMYWKDNDGKKVLSGAVKKGLARSFQKFDSYALGKYNRDDAVKLRDVLFLCHAKPRNDGQAAVWGRLVDGTLESPDTWEVALSGGQDKKATWIRLLDDGKLGGLALLRNLRNMEMAGVPPTNVKNAIKTLNWRNSRVLPFRFVAAARHAPRFEKELGEAMLASLQGTTKLSGRTLLVVDVSGSMQGPLSTRSEMNRIDAAAALAVLLRGVSSDVTIYATAGNDYSRVHATKLVPSRDGFALVEAIHSAERELGGGGIFMVQAMDYIAEREKEPFDRVIIITDEQDCDNRPGMRGAAFNAKRLGGYNYVINVAPYAPGLDLKNSWTRVSGFSERVVDWIKVSEELG